MKKNEYVVYAIKIDGLSKTRIKTLLDHLNKLVPGQYQQIQVPTKDARGTISVPRLCTFWRGDEEEANYQAALGRLLYPGEGICIQAAPWQPLVNYPQGDLTL